MLARVKSLVWNASERRPRALWRVALMVVLVLAVSIGVGVGIGRVAGGVNASLTRTLGERLAGLAVSLLGMGLFAGLMTATVVVAGRYIDHRRLSDFGFHLGADWWADFAFGLALGAALMTAVFAVELAAGWIRVTGTFRPAGWFVPSFLTLVVLLLFVGFYEELLVRGYVLTNAVEGLVGVDALGERGATLAAMLLSSSLFGVAHANNPNATLVSTGAITFAGMMLALGYVLTGELALPIGLHISWNLFQGGVYGFPVSGLGFDVAVVAIEQRGPAVFTGGTFGPEAGLLGVGAVVLGSLATVAWVAHRRGRVGVADGLSTPDLRT